LGSWLNVTHYFAVKDSGLASCAGPADADACSINRFVHELIVSRPDVRAWARDYHRRGQRHRANCSKNITEFQRPRWNGFLPLSGAATLEIKGKTGSLCLVIESTPIKCRNKSLRPSVTSLQ